MIYSSGPKIISSLLREARKRSLLTIKIPCLQRIACQALAKSSHFNTNERTPLIMREKARTNCRQSGRPGVQPGPGQLWWARGSVHQLLHLYRPEYTRAHALAKSAAY